MKQQQRKLTGTDCLIVAATALALLTFGAVIQSELVFWIGGAR